MQDRTSSPDSPTTDTCPSWCIRSPCGTDRVHWSPERPFRTMYDQVVLDLRLSSVTPEADGLQGEPTVVWLGENRFLPHEALELAVELVEAAMLAQVSA
jgi:hypothetical protein